MSRDRLRFLTCGGVDDGKSTLIGRLLHDAGAVLDDQLSELEREREKRGGGQIDLSLLVDGLQAEREQGITIDVAYRYFSTSRRSFVIADCPGHVQYTRNMATGASHCELAVIVVDATRGVLEQTRRHAFIATLMGIRQLAVVVSKMDLVDWSRQRFEEIRNEFLEFAARLHTGHVEVIPVSALRGDNVVVRSSAMAWWGGRSLLDHLETVPVASRENLIDFRFPVQLVLRDGRARLYAGRVASGVVRVGDDIAVLPSLQRTRIATISIAGRASAEAHAGSSVAIGLADQVDVSRGDLFVHPNNSPKVSRTFDAMLVWMDQSPLQPGREYLVRHGQTWTAGSVTEIRYRINVSTLRREPAGQLAFNEIGRARIETQRPLAFDSFERSRPTGSFIIVDRLNDATVAAGMILERETVEDVTSRRSSPDAGTNVREVDRGLVDPLERAARAGQRPFLLWITGLPRSGKTSIAMKIERLLFDSGHQVLVLDGERLRGSISADLGFSDADRAEHVRRTAGIARLALDGGMIVIAALVSPSAADREMARTIVHPYPMLEIFCDVPVETCEERDRDGLYERARRGEIRSLPGVDSAYEPPSAPFAVVGGEEPDRSADAIVTRLEEEGRLRPRE